MKLSLGYLTGIPQTEVTTGEMLYLITEFLSSYFG